MGLYRRRTRRPSTGCRCHLHSRLPSTTRGALGCLGGRTTWPTPSVLSSASFPRACGIRIEAALEHLGALIRSKFVGEPVVKFVDEELSVSGGAGAGSQVSTDHPPL